MNELKYCKFCGKEKPIKDFTKSGFAIKNICRECQNKKNNQIYKNSKKVEKLEQENKQLQERIEYLERSNNRREDTILEQRQEISDLEDNWNKLKEWINKHYDYYMNNEDFIGGRLCFTDMKNKMQEIEGNDSNE